MGAPPLREPNPVGAPTKIRLAAAGDFSGGGIRRDLVNGGTSHCSCCAAFIGE